MSWIRGRSAVILTRLSLAEFDGAQVCGDLGSLLAVAEHVDDALDEACARYRYPRPALVLRMGRPALGPVQSASPYSSNQ